MRSPSNVLQDNFISAPAEKVGVSDFQMDDARSTYFEELGALVEANSDDIAFDGGSALVKSLLQRKIKIAVASSAPLKKVEKSLKAAGINIDDFGAVCCEDTFSGPLKPEPDVFLKAAEDLGVKPANAVVIEDADIGVQAARKGGKLSHPWRFCSHMYATRCTRFIVPECLGTQCNGSMVTLNTI